MFIDQQTAQQVVDYALVGKANMIRTRLAGPTNELERTGNCFVQRDAVVAEIERAEFLSAEVRAALVDCARRCTPDWAFRVLLRAVVYASYGSLSVDQYARMEAIGSALHYGEFLMDSVKYLVEEGQQGDQVPHKRRCTPGGLPVCNAVFVGPPLSAG